MKDKIKNNLKNEMAQGMTEYIIIVALIAIAAIGVITLYGDNIRDMFGASSEALSGEDEAERKMGPLNQNVATHKDLNTFGKNTEGMDNGL
jgi:Flp pilus assembly pilin Flp